MEKVWELVRDFGTWRIEVNQFGGYFLIPNYSAKATRNEPRSQFVTIYGPGRVAYDFPGEVPKFINQTFLSISVER